MRVIGASEVEARLDYRALVEALRAAFREEVTVPLRHHHAVPTGSGDATILVMPAWSRPDPAPAHLGVKLVTVYPDNPRRGLPSVMGVYLLLDGATGEPAALIDGPSLTARRTAAASALAADYLARPDAARHLVIGTGQIAGHLVAAQAATRPIRETVVWGRDFGKAERLARQFKGLRHRVVATDDLAAAVPGADIVSCATTAREPVLRGARLRPGTHVDLVGGFRPDMREADDAVIARSRVYVDTRQGALAEAGDIAQPLAAGVLRADDIAGDLFELCRGQCEGRGAADEITVFKSVGSAIEDLAAARLLVERTAR